MSANVLAAPQMPMEAQMGSEAVQAQGIFNHAAQLAKDAAANFSGYVREGGLGNAVGITATNLIRGKGEVKSQDVQDIRAERSLVKRWAKRVAFIGASAVGLAIVMKAGGAFGSPDSGEGVDAGGVDVHTNMDLPAHDVSALPSDHVREANVPWGGGDLEGNNGDLLHYRDEAESDSAHQSGFSSLIDDLTEKAKEAADKAEENKDTVGGNFTETNGEGDTTGANTDTTTGGDTIDATEEEPKDETTVVAPPFGSGETADNNGNVAGNQTGAETTTGTETTPGEQTGTAKEGYEADLGKWHRAEEGQEHGPTTMMGTLEWHSHEIAESHGVHLTSEHDIQLATDRLQAELVDSHGQLGIDNDEARHMQSNYHIKLTEDQVHRILDGLGEDADKDVDGGDTDTGGDTDGGDTEGGTGEDKEDDTEGGTGKDEGGEDKGKTDDERRLEEERRKLLEGEKEGKYDEDAARLDYERRKLEGDLAVPGDATVVPAGTPSPSTSASASAAASPSASASASTSPAAGVVMPTKVAPTPVELQQQQEMSTQGKLILTGGAALTAAGAGYAYGVKKGKFNSPRQAVQGMRLPSIPQPVKNFAKKAIPKRFRRNTTPPTPPTP